MINDKVKKKPEKPVRKPKPSDFIEKRDKAGWEPCKEDIHKVLDTHPPPDKPPKK